MNTKRGIIIMVVAMIVTILLGAIFVAVVFFVSRIGKLSGDYLYSDNTSASLVDVVNNNGQLNGTLYVADIDHSSNTVKQINVPFTGTMADNQVTLTFSVWFYTSTVQGSYDGYHLILIYPVNGQLANVVFSPSSINDYNNAVAKLTQNANNSQSTAISDQSTATSYQLSTEATQTAVAYRSDEQSRLSYDLQNIGGTISQLTSDADFSSLLHGYSHDINSMQSEYQTEQNDANGGCPNYYQVGVDNYQVGVGNYQVGVDDYGLQSQVNSVQGDIANVQDYVQKIQQHWNNLGQQPFSGVSASDISSAIQNGNNAINQAQSNMKSAQSQASGFDAQAAQIVKQAQALYDGMHC